MISSNSIQYMSRQAIKDNAKESLTVLELRNFLDRLIMGGSGNFNVLVHTSRPGIHAAPNHYFLNSRISSVYLSE
jgi:hypothetical protein